MGEVLEGGNDVYLSIYPLQVVSQKAVVCFLQHLEHPGLLAGLRNSVNESMSLLLAPLWFTVLKLPSILLALKRSRGRAAKLLELQDEGSQNP